MRRNHDKRSQREGHIDTVYVDLPELYGVRSIYAKPLKTNYINMAADPDIACDRTFASTQALENFCDRWGIELP